MNYLATIGIEVRNTPIQIGVTSFTPVTPGRTHGSWEDCFPDEGGECEWELISEGGKVLTKFREHLTKQETDVIEERAYEYMCELE